MKIKNKFFSMRLPLFLLNAWASCCSAKEFRIKEVEFTGITAASAAIPTSYKKQLEESDFSEGMAQNIIAELYATDEVDQVKLYRRGEETLVIECVPKPRIVAIDVEGRSPTGISRPDLEDVFKQFLEANTVQVGAKFNQNLVEVLCSQFRRNHESMGIHDLSLHIQVIPISKKSAVRLRISIILGEPASLKQVSILGNKALSSSELYNALSMTSSPLFNDPLVSFFRPSGFSAETVLYEKGALEECYRQNGYLKPELSLPVVELAPTKDGIYVTYMIENEGAQFFWKDIEIVGADQKTKEIIGNFSLKNLIGRPVNYEDVEIIKQRLKERFENEGYLDAEISEQKDEDIENSEVTLKLYCRCGGRTYIRNIFIKDEAGVALPFYLKLLSQNAGSVATSKAIKGDQNILRQMPSFNQVEVSWSKAEGHNNLIDLVYITTEKEGVLKDVSFNIENFFKDWKFGGTVESYNFGGTGRSLNFALESVLQFGTPLEEARKLQYSDGSDWVPFLRHSVQSIKTTMNIGFEDPISFAPCFGWGMNFGCAPKYDFKKHGNGHLSNSFDFHQMNSQAGLTVNFLRNSHIPANFSMSAKISPKKEDLHHHTPNLFNYDPQWRELFKAIATSTPGSSPQILSKVSEICEKNLPMIKGDQQNSWMYKVLDSNVQLRSSGYSMDSQEFPTSGTYWVSLLKFKCHKNRTSYNAHCADFFTNNINGTWNNSAWFLGKYQSYEPGKYFLEKCFPKHWQKRHFIKTEGGITFPVWRQRQMEYHRNNIFNDLLSGTLASLGFGHHGSKTFYPYPELKMELSPTAQLPSAQDQTQDHRFIHRYTFAPTQHNALSAGGLGFFSLGINSFSYWLPEMLRKSVRIYAIWASLVSQRTHEAEKLVDLSKHLNISLKQSPGEAAFNIASEEWKKLIGEYTKARKFASILGFRITVKLPISSIIPPLQFFIGWHISPMLNALFNHWVGHCVELCTKEELGISSKFIFDFEVTSSNNVIG